MKKRKEKGKWHGPSHQSVETARSGEDSHDKPNPGQSGLPLPVRVTVDSFPPFPSPRQEWDSERKKTNRFNWLVFGLNVLTFVTVAGYAWINWNMWNEMKEQTSVQREVYVTSQRPRVKITHRIVKPLTFDTPAFRGPIASITIEDTLENVGPNVAVDVSAWEDVIPLDTPVGYSTALKRRSEWCDANRHPDPHSLSGSLLFPKDPLHQQSIVGPPMETVMKAEKANSELPGKVGFVLVGCVVYRSSFEPKTAPTHQTRFIYFLAYPVADAGAVVPFIVPQGAASDLKLVAIPDGFSAD